MILQSLSLLPILDHTTQEIQPTRDLESSTQHCQSVQQMYCHRTTQDILTIQMSQRDQQTESHSTLVSHTIHRSQRVQQIGSHTILEDHMILASQKVLRIEGHSTLDTHMILDNLKIISTEDPSIHLVLHSTTGSLKVRKILNLMIQGFCLVQDCQDHRTEEDL